MFQDRGQGNVHIKGNRKVMQEIAKHQDGDNGGQKMYYTAEGDNKGQCRKEVYYAGNSQQKGTIRNKGGGKW